MLLPAPSSQVGGLNHLLEILDKGFPGNSFESYFGRLGQEQRKSFSAVCDKFTLQTENFVYCTPSVD